jgi:hypothetical protein
MFFASWCVPPRNEDYSVDDVAATVRVVLQRIRTRGVSDVRFTGLWPEKRETLPATIYLALYCLASPYPNRRSPHLASRQKRLRT